MSTPIAKSLDTGRVITKVDLIIDAYSSIRISGLTVNPSVEDLELSLMRLEDMAAEWETRNMTVGYNFEDQPDPNSASNVKAGFKRAFAQNLAMSVIPDFNKTVPVILYRLASASLSNLAGRTAAERINRVPYPNRMARGSGNSLRYNRWSRFYRGNNPVANVNSAKSIFIGDINDYTVHFDSFLTGDEFIVTFNVQVDSGLELVSSSLDGNDVTFRVKGVNPSNEEDRSSSQVTIIITTDTGRVKTERLFFELNPRS